MTDEDVKRKLAAIFSADVKNYSRLMRDDEAATVRTISEYRRLMAGLIHQHHGRVVDSPGDNILAEFASVVDAVQAAVATQKELKTQNDKLMDHRRMEFWIGINLGDIIVEGDRIYGDGVNIAARLEGLAKPGGVCISRTAFDQIEDKLPLGYEYLGERNVKNIPKPVQAYHVVMDYEEFIKKPSKKSSTDSVGIKQAYSKAGTEEPIVAMSSRKRLLTAIICLLLGVFGAHRFYTGRMFSAVLQFLTLGGLGIWMLTDFLIIIFGEFSDGKGKKIKNWI